MFFIYHMNCHDFFSYKSRAYIKYVIFLPSEKKNEYPTFITIKNQIIHDINIVPIS